MVIDKDEFCILIDELDSILNNNENIKFESFFHPKKVNISRRVFKCSNKVTNEFVQNYYSVLKFLFYDKTLNEECSKVIHRIEKSYSNEKINYIYQIDLLTFFDLIDANYIINKIKKKIQTNNDLGIELQKIEDVIVKCHTVIMEKKFIIDKEILKLENSNIDCDLCNLNKIPKSCQNLNKLGINCNVGIPQGLAFANLYANIYMEDIDNEMKKLGSCEYIRYVDDIMLLSQFKNRSSILKKEIKSRGLAINSSKYKFYSKKDPDKINIQYLGHLIKGTYNQNKLEIAVKKESIKKRYTRISNEFDQIERVIYSQLYSDAEKKSYILFSLNTMVAGYHDGYRQLGWINFFQNINDLSILFQLDKTILKRLIDICEKHDCTFTGHELYAKIKKHSKTFHAIRNISIEKNKRYLTNGIYFHKSHELNKVLIDDMIALIKIEYGVNYDKEKDYNKIIKKFSSLYYKRMATERRELLYE